MPPPDQPNKDTSNITAYQTWRVWERAAAGLLALGLLAGVVAVGLRSPAESAWLPECPSRAIGGVLCAGCGSTRATHELLNGHFGAAMRLNPVAVLAGIPVGVLGWFQLAGLAVRGRWVWAGWTARLPGWSGWGVLAVVVVWSVARNLPFAWLDWARPPGW